MAPCGRSLKSDRGWRSIKYDVVSEEHSAWSRLLAHTHNGVLIPTSVRLPGFGDRTIASEHGRTEQGTRYDIGMGAHPDMMLALSGVSGSTRLPVCFCIVGFCHRQHASQRHIRSEVSRPRLSGIGRPKTNQVLHHELYESALLMTNRLRRRTYPRAESKEASKGWRKAASALVYGASFRTCRVAYFRLKPPLIGGCSLKKSLKIVLQHVLRLRFGDPCCILYIMMAA